MSRRPAECFPLGLFIQDEMNARGWTSKDVARRMGGAIRLLDMLCIDMILAVHDPDLILDIETAEGLGRAFGVSPEYFITIDRAWREWAKSRPPIIGVNE